MYHKSVKLTNAMLTFYTSPENLEFDSSSDKLNILVLLLKIFNKKNSLDASQLPKSFH